MHLSDTPFAEEKFMTVNGQRMAYIDEGEGDAIVFSHGNPTSSYLWRNIMPACRRLGRLIACDLIGQGDSDRLPILWEMYLSLAGSLWLFGLARRG